MDLLPDDPDRLAGNLEGDFARLPVLAETGIARVVNGPITYSPDGLPLIGKIPGLRNAYACLGLRAGIGEGGGHGKCLAEVIVRLAAESFWLVSAAAAEHHDLQWLHEHLEGAEGAIENLTARLSTLVIAGPRARDLLSQVTGAPLDNDAFPWLGARRIDVAGAEVQALRVNFLGELGWELHVAMEDLRACYDHLVEAGEEFGLAHFGAYAMESLRLEKGYRHWKADLTTEFSPLEASLDRFVKLDKGDFLGRDALRAQKETGVATRFAPLLVDCETASAQMGAPIWSEGEVVGSVSSGGYGHRIVKNIALAFLRADLAKPGRQVAVTILGEARPALVAEAPLYDPGNERLKA